MKKILSFILLSAILTSSLLSGCGCDDGNSEPKSSETSSSASDATVNKENSDGYTDPVASITAQRSDDKYRNYYQIFVNSFCDSDGDTIGDLQGIISQLDYLNDGDPNSGDDLGVDGIWLTPIMPSKSYHKYDVENYYDIDPAFGTLDDFDELIDECDKRGIKLIIDLVLNHASSQHPLYLSAVEEISQGKTDGDAEYFEIHRLPYFSEDANVNILSNGYACEANFSPDMPEWNLNSEKTRQEFLKIAKFWIDRGVGGFRLDAVKYYTNDTTDGVEFLKWFYDECKKMKSDIYMVGENWTDNSEIEKMYKSGIDSLFPFKYAQASGTIIKNIISRSGKSTADSIKSYEERMKQSSENFINTLFLSNHDQMRSGNALEAYGLDFQKFAAAVYMLFPGNPFIYYGEEIGMTSEDSTDDGYYRTGMIFDSDNLPDISIGGKDIDSLAPSGGGVKQQLEDEDSLLNFYRRIIKIKNQNPEIARGTITSVQDFGDNEVCAYFVEYQGSKLMIIHNFSSDESKQLEITEEILPNAEIRADLVTGDEKISLESGKLTLPAHSTVILKSIA